MKQNGLFGGGTGKLGSAVFSQVFGEQIVRQYQPSVANPNTSLQVDQRSKFKLMSQLSASLAPSIAIPREGLKSPRNLFAKKNFDLITNADGVAQIPFDKVQITSGSIALASELTITGDSEIVDVAFANPLSEAISRVVYNAYLIEDNGQLQYINSAISEDQLQNRKFRASFELIPAGRIVVYAYGLMDADAGATARYQSYNIATGADVAKLAVTRTLQNGGTGLTKSVAKIANVAAAG